MIQFIHTADIHFGMENYGKLDVKTGIHSRLLDFQKALNLCIDYAIEKQVDFFMFSGDAYKTAHPSPTQQKLLLQCFLRLHHAKIPVVIVVGNHDHPLSFGKANSLDVFNELPLDGFHVIAKPTSFTLTTKNGPINIVGIPWPTRNTIAINSKHLLTSGPEITEYISKAVSSIIRALADELDPSIPALLAGHLTVSSGVFSGSEKRAIYGTDPIIMPSHLAIKPFDYVALGHLHRYQNLNPNGYPAIVYSGSIERIDFGERKEEKGFCHVTVHEKNNTTHEFIPVPTRPFIQIEATLNNESTQTEQLIAAIQKHPITGAVLKIVYHIPAGKKDLVDLQAVQRACSSAMHIVGITPVREPIVRERRACVQVDMDLQTLLTSYFATRTDLTDRTKTLIEKTMHLAQELQEKECEES
ncbi:MAG TPA: exonuclease SbcCD subunit D [Candidatus Babeliales bacterium]|nr:exonuclease SbcCD subunit D [Candidatus Babeliales bacterium]